MKEKILTTLADMKTQIERDSKHVYRNPVTGEMYQGVSTVSSIVPKDWLAAWGSKEAVKALGFTDYTDFTVAIEVWNKIKACKTVNEYVKILQEAKGASSRKSKKALVDGTKGHAWLESFVEARINGSTLILPGINEPLFRPTSQFVDWEHKNVDCWIASEALVVNPEKRYAGQLDAICVLKTGELVLVDFKFASSISEDYYLQTAGYQACFESYGINFDKRLIIRLPKTLEKEEWNPKTYSYSKIPNNIEVFTVPTNYIGDREAFYSALPLKQWINMVDKMNKR